MAEEVKNKGLELQTVSLNLDNLAYTVYSSGTTGKPKGRIKITHVYSNLSECIVKCVFCSIDTYAHQIHPKANASLKKKTNWKILLSEEMMRNYKYFVKSQSLLNIAYVTFN